MDTAIDAMLKMKENKKRKAAIKAINVAKINGHQYVDLGLPSGLKWATCNIGATSPGEPGYYYAWAETKTKSSYSLANSLTAFMNNQMLRAREVINPSGNLTKSNDAASANWGGLWRMPTERDFQELLNYCEWSWQYYDGHLGYFVTGPNKNWIFLPAAGLKDGMESYNENVIGYYFSSSIYKDNDFNTPSTLIFNDLYQVMECGGEVQSCGCSIRPVSK